MADETAAIMLGEGAGSETTNLNQTNDSNSMPPPPPPPVMNGVTSSSSMEVDKNDNIGMGETQEKEDITAPPQDDGGGDHANKNAESAAAASSPAATNDANTAEVKSPIIGPITANNDAPNMSNTNATTSPSEPPSLLSLLTPRRKIKKRREDGFVYAEDAKAEKKQQDEAASPAQDPSKEQQSPQAERARKRPRKCPVRDSILIDVPLSVKRAPDLGVAMKRTRRKRIERIKRWVASGRPAPSTAAGVTTKTCGNGEAIKEETKPEGNAGDNEKEASTGEKDAKHTNSIKDKPSSLNDDDGGEGDFIDDDLEDDGEAGALNRSQYGSVIDYLEAKYVRGVMIEDYDERERAKKEKQRQKKKKKKEEGSAENNANGETNNKGDKEEEEVHDDDESDSDGKGSCYESDDSWIDDTLLHEEVAGQVMASSAFGMTQIEEEARKRKREEKRKREKKVAAESSGEPAKEGDDANKELDLSDEDEDSDGNDDDAGADSDFDDGFFVNLGDLQMASGWKDEAAHHEEMVIAPAKKKKTKRAYNKKAASWDKKKTSTNNTAKDESKTVKKKGSKAKAATPGAKKKLAKKATKKEDGKSPTKKKKAVVVDGKTSTKKKKASAEEKTATKKKKAEADGKTVAKKKKSTDGKAATKKKKSDEAPGSAKTKKKKQKLADADENDKSTKPKKKKAASGGDDKTATPPKKKKKKKAAETPESATSPDKKEDMKLSELEAIAKKEKSPATKKSNSTSKEKKSKTQSSSSKEKKKTSATTTAAASGASPKKVSKEKELSTQMRKLYKRRYNSCVKQIKEMTSEELPRKPRNKSTMKVQVNIPPDKSIGDEITFANPNVPGQKLKVKIPKKADMEKRSFVVSIPAPKVTEPVELRENNFPKEFKETLYNYSCAYDDWCDAEGEYNETLPASKRKQFKAGTEKNKKFDELIKEFPKNLATPIEITYLRKIVRQERSNKSRRDKRRAGGSAAAAEEQQQQQDLEINIPLRGVEFSFKAFNKLDFEEKEK